MTRFEDLDRLTSRELHDRAFRHAEHHLDVRFFWDLIEEIPVAEMAEGDDATAAGDIRSPSEQVTHAVSESPALMDSLRPVYIDYLERHPDA